MNDKLYTSDDYFAFKKIMIYFRMLEYGETYGQALYGIPTHNQLAKNNVLLKDAVKNILTNNKNKV
jgi:hypothetical protein